MQAAGATKKLKSAGKNVIKSAKRNLPSKPGKAFGSPGKAVKKVAKSTGENWYGPDRALFLGTPFLLDLQSLTRLVAAANC